MMIEEIKFGFENRIIKRQDAFDQLYLILNNVSDTCKTLESWKISDLTIETACKKAKESGLAGNIYNLKKFYTDSIPSNKMTMPIDSVLCETEKAILVNFGKFQKWFPKTWCGYYFEWTEELISESIIVPLTFNLF